MEPETPAYVIPNYKEPRVSKRSVVIIASSVILLLVILGALVAFFRPIAEPVQGMVSALMQPAELASARFAPAAFAEAPAAVYTDGGMTYHTSSFDGRIMALASGHPEGVVAKGSDGTYRVFIGDTSVLSSDVPILSAAVSPSGTAVAVARATKGEGYFYAANDVEVVIGFPATGKEIVIGNGFAPVFTDESHVTWFAPAGIYSIDLATGSATLLLDQTFRNVLSSVTYSPDHALVAWSDLSGIDTVVYRLATGEQVASFSEILPLITLTNESLYSLDVGGWGTAVNRYAFSGGAPVRVHWLPGYYQIRKLAL